MAAPYAAGGVQMTRTEFMAAILRRWYVLLAGGVATIATLAALLGGGGVYTTQVDVVMLPPSGEGQEIRSKAGPIR